MDAFLEILVPVFDQCPGLQTTIDSLCSQSERDFSVLFPSDELPRHQKNLDAAISVLAQGGIKTRVIKVSPAASWVERINIGMAQTVGDWVKLVKPDETLLATYVAKLKQTAMAKPCAQLIRCDIIANSDWGTEIIQFPFAQAGMDPSQVMEAFTQRVDWLAHPAAFAFNRTAWLSLGGLSPYTPVCAELECNAMAALRYGMENIPETLAVCRLAADDGGTHHWPRRVNRFFEMWLVLKQLHNFSLANRLPWPMKCMALNAFLASEKLWRA